MPVATRPPARRQSEAAARGDAPVAVLPFVAGAHEHTEPMFDVTVTPGAAAQNLGPFDVPAYGYLRHLFLEVTATGGALGTGVLSADYPFNLFQNITLNDVNGAPIFGPLDGYAALWSNIAGGYAFQMDPRRSPWYVSTINAAFPLRIPVEISHHDGLGSLANQNAAAAYKLQLTTNPLATILSTVGTATAPAFRIRGYLEAWSLPNEVDMAGRPQAQLPPAHGTSQFWTSFTKAIAVGNNSVLLPRVGNMIRNILFICRDATGARVDTVFPNPANLQWDARSLNNDTQNYAIQRMFERLNNITARDTGVFHYAFDHSVDNVAGDDAPTLWLPTVQSSRLELTGVAAAAGSMQVMTNDIAPVEVIPSERYVETSRTGFHPERGVSGPAVQ